MKTNIVGAIFLITSVFPAYFCIDYTARLISHGRTQSLIMALITLVLVLTLLIVGLSLIRRKPWSWNIAMAILIPLLSGSIFAYWQNHHPLLLLLITISLVSTLLLIYDRQKPLAKLPPPTRIAPKKNSPPPISQNPVPSVPVPSAPFLNPFGTITQQKKLSSGN